MLKAITGKPGRGGSERKSTTHAFVKSPHKFKERQMHFSVIFKLASRTQKEPTRKTFLKNEWSPIKQRFKKLL